ncbi:hypothetical protein X943_002139 [Babesia divergens]|uniref:Uncharacterized protein n=1 Tax=Babesia divergens TaxID=32595 RepID=A0AAD9G798_BABDI|nr:hypothetical protein X943_002139 [Babesia divergens]
MDLKASYNQPDYLDNLYIEKEIEETFFPKKGISSPTQPDFLAGSYVLSRRDAVIPPFTCNNYLLEDAVSRNINNTLNKSFFSIYGGLNNGIWSNKSSSLSGSGSGSGSWLGSVSNQSSTDIIIPCLDLHESLPRFYAQPRKPDKCSIFAALSCPSSSGSSLTGRLIEGSLKIPPKSLPQRQPLRQPGQTQHHNQGQAGENNYCGHVKCFNEPKYVGKHELKHIGEPPRKEYQRHEKKGSSTWRHGKVVECNSVKGGNADGRSLFAEAGSIRNVLEASEIWLRHTTTSNFCNKRPILKKHFINENQFYVGVS